MGECILGALWLAAMIVIVIAIVEFLLHIFGPPAGVDNKWIRAFEAILGLIVIVKLLLCASHNV